VPILELTKLRSKSWYLGLLQLPGALVGDGGCLGRRRPGLLELDLPLLQITGTRDPLCSELRELGLQVPEVYLGVNLRAPSSQALPLRSVCAELLLQDLKAEIDDIVEKMQMLLLSLYFRFDAGQG